MSAHSRRPAVLDAILMVLVQPATLHRLLDRVVELARALRATRGRTLPVDGTVVETDVHHPSDSTLPSLGLGSTGHQPRHRAPAKLG